MTPQPADAVKVRVRAYRQGLGDSFLLTFSSGDVTRHMLIDCGVFMGTANQEEKMIAVANDIHTATNGKLDVLVVTHEHWDHLSGFQQAKAVFDSFKIDKLWFAWTENPDDAMAINLRGEANALRANLTAALQYWHSKNPANPDERIDRFASVLGFFGELDLAEGQAGQGLAAARANISTVLSDLRAHPSKPIPVYHAPGEGPFQLDGIKGVNFYVLGPPHDLKLLKHIDPSPGEGYLQLAMLDPETSFFVAFPNMEIHNEDATARVRAFPFDQNVGKSLDQAKADPFFQVNYSGEAWRRIDDEWMGRIGELALRLDSYTNNTSLVLAIEIEATGQVLLFPGDAQVGNWSSWWSLEWPSKAGGGATFDAIDLLRRTVFYKVSHHGSHNGTPSAKGLELMTNRDLIAMIPVDKTHPNLTKKINPWQMPFKALYEALCEHTDGRVLRSDDGVPSNLPVAVAAKLNSMISVDNLYIDINFGD